VRAVSDREIDAAREFIIKQWGSDLVVVHGTSYFPHTLPGFWAESLGRITGLVTFCLAKEACEIVTLDSLSSGKGVGTLLIDRVIQEAKEQKCSRVWLVTTNDNLNALGFYQKRGFTISAIHPKAVAEARKLKPGIPLIAENGIPIRDEIELELKL
jgi:GNAT superfamily N-acetyltransferase